MYVGKHNLKKNILILEDNASGDIEQITDRIWLSKWYYYIQEQLIIFVQYIR